MPRLIKADRIQKPMYLVVCTMFLGLLVLTSMSLSAEATFVESQAWQTWCLQTGSCLPEAQCDDILQDPNNNEGNWPVCLDELLPEDCLVYSVGIADDWSFDELMGAFGCEVHAFDPTVDLPTSLAPNVTFLQWGLTGNSSPDHQKVSENYGKQLGPLLTLEETQRKLGHTKRLNILKMDCEGCEWDFFSYLKHHPDALPDQFAVEMHFSEYFGFHDVFSFYNFENAFQVISKGNYKRFYYHVNTAVGEHNHMSETALQLGFPPDSCCREVIFKRLKPTQDSLFHRHKQWS